APKTPPATAHTRVATVNALALPSAPTAGRTFHILVPSITLSTHAKVRATSVRCKATLRAAHLVGTGSGSCTFRIPATSGSQRLLVQVTVTFKGVSRTRTLGFTVRKP